MTMSNAKATFLNKDAPEARKKIAYAHAPDIVIL
jgi:hypothetical protein